MGKHKRKKAHHDRRKHGNGVTSAVCDLCGMHDPSTVRGTKHRRCGGSKGVPLRAKHSPHSCERPMDMMLVQLLNPRARRWKNRYNTLAEVFGELSPVALAALGRWAAAANVDPSLLATPGVSQHTVRAYIRATRPGWLNRAHRKWLHRRLLPRLTQGLGWPIWLPLPKPARGGPCSP